MLSKRPHRMLRLRRTNNRLLSLDLLGSLLGATLDAAVQESEEGAEEDWKTDA